MRVLRAAERLYMVRVDRGEEVVDRLLAFARELDVPSAALTGLGGVRDVDLAYFDVGVKEYLVRRIHGVLELVSFTGNLARVDGEPFLHAHVMVSDRAFRCYGGHLRAAPVAVTAEFAVHLGDAPLERRFNPELGIKEQRIGEEPAP